MFRTARQSTLDGWLKQFKSTANQKTRQEIVERIATRAAHKMAKVTLMGLLAEEPVQDADMARTGNFIPGTAWPYAWRSIAYRFLFENLCTSTELFSFAQHIARESRDSEKRIEAINVLVRHYPKHPKTLGTLMRIADSMSWGYVLKEALAKISETFSHHPESFPYLLRTSVWLDDFNIASSAMEKLAAYHAEKPETRPLLMSLATRIATSGIGARVPKDLHAKSVHITAAAINALATAYPDDEDCYELILQHVCDADNSNIVSAAFHGLMKGFRNQPDAVPILIDRTIKESNEFISIAAINALHNHRSDDPRVMPFLLERAKNDNSSAARMSAIEGLASHYADNTSVEDLIISIAAWDPCRSTQKRAVIALGSYFRKSARSLDQLINIFQTETYETVRETAGDVLMYNFRFSLKARWALRVGRHQTPEERHGAAIRKIFGWTE